MSLNVANISARFGLDPAEFLERLRGVSGATKFFSDEMKRSMRETSREGTESFRLIDEALGIHISRPLTRLLVNEFPSFAKGLQALLGVGAVGALGAVGFEVFEKISKGIEKAQKAQEEFRQSTLKLENAFAEAMASYEKSAKLRSLAGAAKSNFTIDDAAFEKASKQVATLTELAEKNAKAAADAGSVWTHLLASAGDAVHVLVNTASTLGTEATNAQFKALQDKIEQLRIASAANPLKGLQDSLSLVRAEAKKAEDALVGMQAMKLSGMDQVLNGLALVMHAGPGKLGFSQDEIRAAENYKTQVENIRKLLEAASKDDVAVKNAAASTRALEANREAIREMQGDLKGWNDASDASWKSWMRTNEELEKALGNLNALTEAAQRGQKAKGLFFGDVGGVAPPTSTADLSGSKLTAFAANQTAQFDLIAKAQEAALSPLQKYSIEWAKLELAFKDRGDADSVATKLAAQNALIEDYTRSVVKAADATHKLQEEMQKQLERSNEASAGLKAYGIQLQLNAAENGKFVFAELTAATKGAEDNAAKSLMAILESQRGGHLKLIHDLEALWSSYFKNLAEMGIKHGFDQLLGPVGKAITGGKGVGGDASLSGAGTVLMHAGTELLSAAQALKMSGGFGAGGGDAGGGGGSPFGDPSQLGGAIPFFAAGGDATPGSSFISGEAGAEEVNLDGRGGAHITPLGASESGNTYHTHNNYDMRGSIVTDDVMRRTEAQAAIATSEKRMMQAIPTLQRELSLRKRS